MTNLLPQKMKARVRKEYRLRMATVLFFALAAALGATSLLFIPSLLLVSSKQRLAENSLEQKGAAVRDTFALTVKDIERANALASQLGQKSSDVTVTRVLDEIGQETNGRIELQGIVITKEKDSAFSAELRGVAITRDDLAQFTDRLKRNQLMSEVVIPFSDLAQAKDAHFTVSFMVRPNTSP